MLKGLTHAFNKHIRFSFWFSCLSTIHLVHICIIELIKAKRFVRQCSWPFREQKIRKIIHSNLNLNENLSDTFLISLQFNDWLLFKVKHVHHSAIRLVTNWNAEFKCLFIPHNLLVITFGLAIECDLDFYCWNCKLLDHVSQFIEWMWRLFLC